MTAEFGTRVLVLAEAMRLKKGYSDFIQAGRLQDPRTRQIFPGPDWPGERPDDREPNERANVLVRRVPLMVPAVGFVVGRTNIQEGWIERSHSYDDSAYWVATRAFNVLQVALPTEGKARIVTVLEEDMKLLEAEGE